MRTNVGNKKLYFKESRTGNEYYTYLHWLLKKNKYVYVVPADVDVSFWDDFDHMKNDPREQRLIDDFEMETMSVEV